MLILASLLSCQFSTSSVAFDLQTETDENPNSKVSKIVFLDKNNSLKTLQNQTEIQSVTNNTTLTLEVLQNQLTPILVYYEDTPHPQGTLYPYSCKTSKTGGFVAHCFFRLLNENNDFSVSQKKAFLCKVNWQKVLTYLEKFENPWELNQDRLLNDIATKNLNSKSFVLKK